MPDKEPDEEAPVKEAGEPAPEESETESAKVSVNPGASVEHKP